MPLVTQCISCIHQLAYTDVLHVTCSTVYASWLSIGMVSKQPFKAFQTKSEGVGRTHTHTHTHTDCGSGIGRVSKRLLLPLFSEGDLVEQNKAFLDKAVTYMVGSICSNYVSM